MYIFSFKEWNKQFASIIKTSFFLNYLKNGGNGKDTAKLNEGKQIKMNSKAINSKNVAPFFILDLLSQNPTNV